MRPWSLTFWSENLDKAHIWPDFGEISSSSYEHTVLGLSPAVTLTFDLLTLKSNEHIYEPKYIYVTKIG